MEDHITVLLGIGLRTTHLSVGITKTVNWGGESITSMVFASLLPLCRSLWSLLPLENVQNTGLATKLPPVVSKGAEAPNMVVITGTKCGQEGLLLWVQRFTVWIGVPVSSFWQADHCWG